METEEKGWVFYSNINGRKILKFQLGNNLINDGEGGKKNCCSEFEIKFFPGISSSRIPLFCSPSFHSKQTIILKFPKKL
jgi:hypothetical protein